jgi:hypothetical protein
MNQLRRILSAVMLCAAALISIPDASAQNLVDYSVFSQQGTPPIAFAGTGVTNPIQGNISNCIWFATSSRALGVPRFLRYRIAGDTTNDLRYLTSTNSRSITNFGIAGTNVLYCDTTGFASNDLALIEFKFNGAHAYQLVNVTNVSASALSISAGAKYATQPASSTNSVPDIIWKLSQQSYELNGVATNTISNSGQPVFIGREGVPTVLMLSYSNRAEMNLVVGDWWRQPRP